MTLWVRWGLAALLATAVLGARAATGVPERCAYVVSSHDRLLSRVDLASGEVVLGLGTVGAVPNRVEVSADLSRAVVVNSGSVDLTLYDLQTETVRGTVLLPGGSNPWTCELDGSRGFVTCLLADILYEIDLDARALTDSVETGVAPEGICLAQGKLYVANTGFHFDDLSYEPGTVSVFAASDLAPLATVPVGLNPQECAVAPDGTVHVICSGDYASTAGSVYVIDPLTDAAVDSLAIDGYPVGAAIDSSGAGYLNLTTFSFATEVWVYDAANLVLIRDGADPLLPTTDFYGNLRLDGGGHLYAPAFMGDILIREDPSAPGAPDAWLVGDGPVDLAIVEREPPVGVLVSGLRAESVATGIRLSWHGAVDADVIGFDVSRAMAGVEAASIVARDLAPERQMTWIDSEVEPQVHYLYRVGAIDRAGERTWSASLLCTWQPPTAVFTVERARPNPFRTTTTIAFRLPDAAQARLEILDVSGRRVLARDLRAPQSGSAEFQWDGRDDERRMIAPGVYFVRLTAGAETRVERVLRLR